jgi:hypothetical protein
MRGHAEHHRDRGKAQRRPKTDGAAHLLSPELRDG